MKEREILEEIRRVSAENAAREASENLDTCPYCGGTGVIIADLGGFRVSCKACFAQTGLAITPQEAAERWNRRN